MHVRISTKFNCQVTGVTGNFRSSRLPFVDQAGCVVDTEQAWTRARNQQRNWETLTQLVGMYTQMLNIRLPVYDDVTKLWTFDFEVEFPGVFANINGALGILIEQASNVPMITGLGEDTQHSWLIPEKNIFIQQLDNHTHELNQS
jgi:hypothetical protein